MLYHIKMGTTSSAIDHQHGRAAPLNSGDDDGGPQFSRQNTPSSARSSRDAPPGRRVASGCGLVASYGRIASIGVIC